MKEEEQNWSTETFLGFVMVKTQSGTAALENSSAGFIQLNIHII